MSEDVSVKVWIAPLDALLVTCEAEVDEKQRQSAAQEQDLIRQLEENLRAGWAKAVAQVMEMLPVALRYKIDFDAVEDRIRAGCPWGSTEAVPVRIDGLPVLGVNPGNKLAFWVLRYSSETIGAPGGMELRWRWRIDQRYADVRIAIGHAAKMARELNESGVCDGC